MATGRQRGGCRGTCKHGRQPCAGLRPPKATECLSPAPLGPAPRQPSPNGSCGLGCCQRGTSGQGCMALIGQGSPGVAPDWRCGDFPLGFFKSMKCHTPGSTGKGLPALTDPSAPRACADDARQGFAFTSFCLWPPDKYEDGWPRASAPSCPGDVRALLDITAWDIGSLRGSGCTGLCRPPAHRGLGCGDTEVAPVPVSLPCMLGLGAGLAGGGTSRAPCLPGFWLADSWEMPW